MSQCKCGSDVKRKRWESDPSMDIQAILWGAVIVFSFVTMILSSGCTASQLAALEDGLVSMGDCSLYSSVGCASQAMAGCQLPENSGEQGWGSYGDCLVEKSLSCGSAALARCSYRAIAAAAGGPIIIGGTGCKDDDSKAAIKSCVAESGLENEAGAVESVARCTRKICLNLED